MHEASTFIICLLLACGLVVACTPTAARVTPTPFTPLPGKGGITGQIQDRSKRWSGEELFLYAAPFSSDESGQGYYFLEPSLHPNTPLDGDFFQLDVPPGTYVLIAGPTAEEGVLIVDSEQEPLRVKVSAGQVIDLARVQLAP